MHYESIMASIRNIPNIRIKVKYVSQTHDTYDPCAFVKSIFEEFGKNFLQIEFIECRVTISDLKSFLSRTINVESLSFTSCSIETDCVKRDNPRIRTPMLKKLTMKYCELEFQNIALALTPDTIKEFTIVADATLFLVYFFAKQSNLTKLSMTVFGQVGVNGLTVFQSMKLQELSISINGYLGSSLTAGILFRQYQHLTSLDLSYFKLTDVIFARLTTLIHLQIVKFVVNEITKKTFAKISKLQNLMEVTLIRNDGIEDYAHLLIFSRITNNQLTKLEIKYPCMKIGVKVFLQLVHNAPNIQHLSIDSTITFEILIYGTNCMKNLQTLKIQDPQMLNLSYKEMDIMKAHCAVNENMRDLSLKFDVLDGCSFICNMVTLFPNVEKLEVVTTLPVKTLFKFLSIILENLPRLRELELINHISLPLDDSLIDLLKEHVAKMKRVSINADCKETSADVKMLFDHKFSFVSLDLQHLELCN